MKSKWLLTGVLLAVAGTASAELPEKNYLTLETAKAVASASAAEAQRRGAHVVIAVVDEGGYLVYLERLEGSQVASSQVAVDKARTAAIYRRPSRDFEEQVRNGRVSAMALNGAVPLQGGLPLVYRGAVVGAVGVSGETPQEDEDVARAGSDVLAHTDEPAPVSFFNAGEVAAAFARGVPLLEVPEYKVHASRRTEPGLVEVHANETDVLYVVEGAATLVTGGRLLDGRQTAPGETRGTQLEGGDVRTLAPGDVVVVPRGTPHWFRDIHRSPFLYFVVKPIASGGAS